MNVEVTDERVFLLKDNLSMDHAEGRAWGKKLDAFGTVAKVTTFLNRPKDHEFELVYKEHRYQPFWYVECSALYVYERQRTYTVQFAPEVQVVKITGADYPVANRQITLTGLEYCREELRTESFFDGVSREKNSQLASYLRFPSTEIHKDMVNTLAPEGSIIVPPQVKASVVVRDMLTGMIKTLEADLVSEEVVKVDRVDLYYRPVYAFRYRWQGREAVIEFDGLTGDLQLSGNTFEQYLDKMLEPKFLFDISMETMNFFVPGGSIVTKIVKHSLNAAHEVNHPTE